MNTRKPDQFFVAPVTAAFSIDKKNALVLWVYECGELGFRPEVSSQ